MTSQVNEGFLNAVSTNDWRFSFLRNHCKDDINGLLISDYIHIYMYNYTTIKLFLSFLFSLQHSY